MISNHDVDGFSLAVTSVESVYRSLADRLTKRIAKAFQLALDTAECGSAGLDVQDHVDVSGGASDLHSRVCGMELHHQSADQRPLGVRDGLHDLNELRPRWLHSAGRCAHLPDLPTLGIRSHLERKSQSMSPRTRMPATDSRVSRDPAKSTATAAVRTRSTA